MKQTIALIACGKSKRNTKCAARDLYTGDLFKKTRALVERRNQMYYILSALHGLVSPLHQLEPYEYTLLGKSAALKKDWATEVMRELRFLDPNSWRIAIYAGRDYREFLLPMLREYGFEVEIPLERLEIGQQLSYLNAALHAEEAAV